MSTFGDWTSLAVAVGTGWLAWETHRTVKENQKAIRTATRSADAMDRSADATKRSAEATEKSVELLRNASRPYFDLGVSLSEKGICLTVRNVGSGLGVIRLITIRDDVHTNCISRPVECSFQGCGTTDGQVTIPYYAVAANDQVSFHLGVGMKHRPGDQYPGEWASSISIFYEDQQDRFYRARVVYVRLYLSGTVDFRVVGKENYSIGQLPIQLSTTDNIDQFYKQEGFNTPVVYRADYSAFHLLDNVARITQQPIVGIEFTKNMPVSVLNVSFDNLQTQGYPIFKLQIENKIPFDLVPALINNRVEFSIRQQKKFSDYGLEAAGGTNDVQSLATLYKHITRELLFRVSGV